MVLKFKNETNEEVWVSLSFFSPDCLEGDLPGENPWRTRGWYHLLPQQTKTVYGGDLDNRNRYWYYFAESVGHLVWRGPYRTLVHNEAFDGCDKLAHTGGRIVGFRELDIDDYDDYNVNLVV